MLRRLAYGLADDAEHFFLVDRFLEEGDSAGGQGFVAELGRFTAGDENDGGFADFINATQPVENQESVPGNATASSHVRRKMDVEDNQIRALAAHTTDGGGAVHGGANFVASGLKLNRHRLQHDDVVIGDENFRDVGPDGVGGGFRR